MCECDSKNEKNWFQFFEKLKKMDNKFCKKLKCFVIIETIVIVVVFNYLGTTLLLWAMNCSLLSKKSFTTDV
jgi:hypothetical protein